MDRNLIRMFDQAREQELDAIGAARFVAYMIVADERGLPPLPIDEAVEQVRIARPARP